jgi:hypothetical protein
VPLTGVLPLAKRPPAERVPPRGAIPTAQPPNDVVRLGSAAPREATPRGVAPLTEVMARAGAALAQRTPTK